METIIIPPRSGASFTLKKGQQLQVIDIEGEQVSDLICYNKNDSNEYLSSGRTIDYAEKIYLTKGDEFYSNRSNVMFTMIEDMVGLHDFLLTPCSCDTFRIMYGHQDPHQGCFGNLTNALASYGIAKDNIPTTFNLFMNVKIDTQSGKVSVLPPISKANDHVIIEAKMDLIVGLTACSAGMSNNYSFKPIGYKILN